jgi:hypothetical protein
MKGDMANFLVAASPKSYSHDVTVENGKNVIYLLLNGRYMAVQSQLCDFGDIYWET